MKENGVMTIKEQDAIQMTGRIILALRNQVIRFKGCITAKCRSNAITTRLKIEAVMDTFKG